jgi:ankyrin repeat protein
VLTHCIKLQNAGAVDILLKAGADPNQLSRKGVTPISAAAHKGNTVIMQVLINSGATVNAINSSGSTALIQAAHFGHLSAVKLLLQNNANADFANVKGTTALMRASQEGHVDITKALIEAEVDVNRRNHEGMNALMLASQRGHADIVLLLIKAGAVMDEQTAQGSTALMLACKRGHEKCAEVLVSMGAEIFMRDRRYRTAKDTATRRNHIGLLCWLDTQVQVRKIQEFRHKVRCQLIVELRNAYLHGKLQLSGAEQFVDSLVKGMKFSENAALVRDDEDASILKTYNEFTSGSLDMIYSARSVESTLKEVESVVLRKYGTVSASVPNLPYAQKPAPKSPNFADWQWASLLYK